MNLSHVIERRFEAVVQRHDWRDCALYALSLGMGSDPLDEDELPYVYEGRAQRVVPSQCVVTGWPAFWHADLAAEIDWVRILHGEERFMLHKPMPLDAEIRADHSVRAVVDKGPGRGALIYFDTELSDVRTGERLASLCSTQFLRGDGGCGSHGVAPVEEAPLPAGLEPCARIDYRTPPQAALLYRLASRDYMPLHADPEVARRAGFDRPISHGLNTMGLACRAVLKHRARRGPEWLRSMFVRFAQPAYPGETIRVELFEEGDRVRFRARALERDAIVLDRGECCFGSH